MKAIAIFIILAVGGYFGWQAIQTKPDAGTPQAVVTENTTDQSVKVPTKYVYEQNVKVTFKGFGPGKVHEGSFSNVTSNLIPIDETGGIQGDVVVDMNSITTGIDKLTSDLKSKNFFDVAKYPTAKFVLNGIKDNDNTATGSMTIHGITKNISFPVNYISLGYEATFTLNMKDFGINQTFANETIELSVVVFFPYNDHLKQL